MSPVSYLGIALVIAVVGGMIVALALREPRTRRGDGVDAFRRSMDALAPGNDSASSPVVVRKAAQPRGRTVTESADEPDPAVPAVEGGVDRPEPPPTPPTVSQSSHDSVADDLDSNHPASDPQPPPTVSEPSDASRAEPATPPDTSLEPDAGESEVVESEAVERDR